MSPVCIGPTKGLRTRSKPATPSGQPGHGRHLDHAPDKDQQRHPQELEGGNRLLDQRQLHLKQAAEAAEAETKQEAKKWTLRKKHQKMHPKAPSGWS